MSYSATVNMYSTRAMKFHGPWPIKCSRKLARETDTMTFFLLNTVSAIGIYPYLPSCCLWITKNNVVLIIWYTDIWQSQFLPFLLVDSSTENEWLYCAGTNQLCGSTQANCWKTRGTESETFHYHLLWIVQLFWKSVVKTFTSTLSSKPPLFLYNAL